MDIQIAFYRSSSVVLTKKQKETKGREWKEKNIKGKEEISVWGDLGLILAFVSNSKCQINMAAILTAYKMKMILKAT
jgi:hypothetical protein